MKKLTAYRIIERLLSKDLSGLDSAKIKSLESWLDNKGNLTQKQRRMLNALDNKYTVRDLKKDYQLYLISNGVYIKIGISKNPCLARS